jgi:hypothetical protein
VFEVYNVNLLMFEDLRVHGGVVCLMKCD